MKMPTLEDRSQRRQDEHPQADKSKCELGKFVFRRGLTEEFHEKKRQPSHQEKIRQENHNIQQRSAVGLGEDVCGMRL